MSETRKVAAILVSDVVGYSRPARTDEDRILARLRALLSNLIDPTIAVHCGRIVKRTSDGSIVEFCSVGLTIRLPVRRPGLIAGRPMRVAFTPAAVLALAGCAGALDRGAG